MKEIQVSLTSPAAVDLTAYRAAATVSLPTGTSVEIAASSTDSGLSALRSLRMTLRDFGLMTGADLLVVHDHTARAPAPQNTTRARPCTKPDPATDTAAPTAVGAVGASGDCAADPRRYAIFSRQHGREVQLSRWMPPLRARTLHDTLAASVSKNIYLLRHDDD